LLQAPAFRPDDHGLVRNPQLERWSAETDTVRRVPILPVNAPAVVRTDFGDDAAWAALLAAIRTPSSEGFLGNVVTVDDREFDGLDVGRVLAALPADASVAVLFIADTVTLARPDMPLLVVRLLGALGQTFRVVPAELWSVENNLSVANLSWEDFGGVVDGDGVFRGF
jgi:hypothetical protein